jgi:predicted nucleotidyltransferase component of viral defense system
MYDFSKQKAMRDAILLLLEENNLNKVSTLGGGTALASYYWNHRYSTDIDVFIYDKKIKNIYSKNLIGVKVILEVILFTLK